MSEFNIKTFYINLILKFNDILVYNKNDNN